MKRITPISIPDMYKAQGMTPTPWLLGERGDKCGCILAVLACSTGIDARGPSTPDTVKLLATRGFDMDYLCGLRAGFDGLGPIGDPLKNEEEDHNTGVFDGLQALQSLRQAGLLPIEFAPQKPKKGLDDVK